MRISAYTIGRDNNFNLLRMIAATAVLVSHSYALTIGSASAEPFATSLGKSLGSIAVDIFFVSSGFLICASLINRPNVFQFAKARFLRIFPALFVVLLFTAFVIGPIYSSRSIIEYFSSLSVYRHVIQNAVLIFGIHYTLPGVFENNAFSAGVNGSLWTLPLEIKMYAALAILFFASRLLKARSPFTFEALVVLVVVFTLIVYVSKSSILSPILTKLGFMFFSGALIYLFRAKIELNLYFFASLLVLLALSRLGGIYAFNVVYFLLMPYIIIFLALYPGGPIRLYNRLGDYSYGVYIVAFPIQQMLVASIPSLSPLAMIIFSFAITLPLAVLSWTYVERPALRLKGH